MENDILKDLLNGQKVLDNEIRAMAQQLFTMDGKIDKFAHITIRNGNDREIRYKRDDFFQMLYDRKDIWKPIQRVLERILLVLTVSALILKFFNVF